MLAAYAREMGGRPNVVINLCDGDETNDVPGVSVIRTLRTLGLTYTGAEEHFFQVTTSKIDMKRAFDAGRVATSPWAVVEDGVPDAEALFERLGRPLIVKPAVSAGSMGITIKSVVHDAAALREQVRILHEGYKGWNLVSGGVFKPDNEKLLQTAAFKAGLRVNGDLRGGKHDVWEGGFKVPFLVSYISKFMTLEPGDLIATGTPPGVGPLAPGCTVRVEIDQAERNPSTRLTA